MSSSARDADQAQPAERLTLTADEVAVLLGLSRTRVYESIHAGEIPSIRFGRRLLVPARPLYELIEGAARRTAF